MLTNPYFFSLLFLLLISSQNTFSQKLNTIGFLEVGLSSMERDLCSNFAEQKDYDHKPTLSWGFGTNIEYQITRNILFGSGLKISAMGGADEKSVTLLLSNDEGKIIDRTKIEAYYLGLPLYFKYKIDKIQLRAGYQLNHFLAANYKIEKGITEGDIPESVLFITGKTNEQAKFDAFDHGILLGISYTIYKQFSLRANYYRGLSKTNSDLDPNAYCRKNNQFVLGLEYAFQ